MGKVREPLAQYVVDTRGRKKSVILPIETYERLLHDLQDLILMVDRKAEPSISWGEARRRRERIARKAKRLRKLFREGKARVGTADDLLSELDG